MKPGIFINILFTVATVGCSSQGIESDIVLINAGTLDREGIAKLVASINQWGPKVVAVDLRFFNDSQYSKDQFLADELSKCKSLVMASLIGNYSGKNIDYERFVEGSEPWFLINAKTGFTNSLLEQDGFNTLKRFSIKETVNGKIEYHFSIRAAMAFDSLKAMNFVMNHSKIIDVDYKNGKREFKRLSASDVLTNKLDPRNVEGKIAMIGFLGPGDEDKFFSPLNKRARPYEPDTYGLEYLACIVAQVLEYK